MCFRPRGFVRIIVLSAICAATASGQTLRVRPRPENPGQRADRVAAWGDSADFAAALATPPLAADTPPSVGPAQARMTVDELERMALGNNPTLVQAQRRTRALRGKYVQSGLYPNPVIGYSGEEMGDDGRAGLQGGFIGAEVVTAGKLRLNRAVVSHEIAQAEQEAEIQRRRVLNDVRAAAYGVMVATRTVRLQEQLSRISQDDTKTAEQLFNAREVSRVDVLQARIEANATRLKLDNARNDYRSAWRRLAAVIGVPGMEPAPLEDRLEDQPAALTWEQSLSRLLAHSPELARAHAGVQRAQCAVSRAHAGRVPNLELEAAALYNHGPEDPVASVRVGVPLQIFDRNQGNIYRAHAELAAARQEVRRIELALQDRLAEAFRQYTNARQQVHRYRDDILPDARKALEMVQQGYAQGELGYLELLTTQRTYFHSQLDYVASLRSLWESRVLIEGLLLSGALDRPDDA